MGTLEYKFVPRVSKEKGFLKAFNMFLLRVEEIYKSCGNEEALRGISLALEKRETKVVIGPSGTGKSTLLRCITRLTEPDRGQVWLADTG